MERESWKDGYLGKFRQEIGYQEEQLHGSFTCDGIPNFRIIGAYYNPETDWFYTKKEAKTLSPKKKKYRISYNGSVLSSGHQLGDKGERLHKYWWYHKPFFSGPATLHSKNLKHFLTSLALRGNKNLIQKDF